VATSITITKTGPLLDANVSSTLKRGIRAGIFKVGTQIAASVQEPLVNGHGRVTGNLRGSITSRQFSDLGYEVRSRSDTGEPLVYAYWVETGKRRGLQTRFRGYQMFQRAAAKWNSSRSRIAKIMLTNIRKALT
jgi:hypothetical protein